jgi:hypothetical protein
MSWICPICGVNNVNVNKFCANASHKKVERSETFEPFDSIDEIISLHRIRLIDRLIGELMTPQEELFSKLFNHEKLLVKDMDLLTLRAHREELAQMAYEARARLSAVDDEEKSRKKKNGPQGPTGFQRSLNIDDVTSDAINNVKERQKKLTRSESVRAGLLKIMSVEDADKAMAARNISDKVRVQNHTKPAASSTENKPTESKTLPFVNPFEKKG